jgi:hypothetical protein
MASLHNVEPRPEQKSSLNEDTRPRSTPKSIRLYKGITFPNDGVIFRCTVDKGGKEWLDYGWIRVGARTPGSEPDYHDDDPDDNPRQLVKFWMFAEIDGEKYALVDIYRKYRQPRPQPGGPVPEQLWSHPILRRYEHVYYARGGRQVSPFFAVPVSSIIGAACVFPDTDQGRQVGDHSAGQRVMYHPPLIEMCGYENWRLPGDEIIPEPPVDELADIDMSDGGYEQSSDDGKKCDDDPVDPFEGESDSSDDNWF